MEDEVYLNTFVDDDNEQEEEGSHEPTDPHIPILTNEPKGPLTFDQSISAPGISDVPDHGLQFDHWCEFSKETDLLSALKKEDIADDSKEDYYDNSNMVGTVSSIDPFETLSQSYVIEAFPGFEDFVKIQGTPLEDIALFDQQDAQCSCAIATISMMFRALGYDPGEDLIAEIFHDLGVYDPGFGTYPDLIDEVINALAQTGDLHIQAMEINGFNEYDLEKLLGDGIRPLVAVDAYELYGNGQITINDILDIPDAGHAVQVTGFIRSAEGNCVMINDPGFEGGAAQKIPVDRFMEAAEDFGFKAITITRV